MNDAIRWLHVSDFHVGKDPYAQRRLFHKILDHVSEQKKNEFIPDFVFITGDIANKGRKKEYAEFRSSFYSPLQQLLPEAKVFAVPGNHDIVRPPVDALNPDALLAAATRFFDPTKEGKIARGQVTPRFKHYKQMMALDVSSDWVVSEKGAFAEIVDLKKRK